MEANRNAVNASAGGRAGPRQRMPNIWEGGPSQDVVGSRLEGCSVEGGTRLLEAKPFLQAQSIRSDVSSHLPVPIRKLKHRVLLGHVQKPVFEFDRVVSHI